jgi:hypothetical protein
MSNVLKEENDFMLETRTTHTSDYASEQAKLEEEIKVAYGVMESAEYAAANASRILDDARDKWERLVFKLRFGCEK